MSDVQPIRWNDGVIPVVDVLTIGQATRLGELLRACQGNKRVTWLVTADDTPPLRTITGVARCIGDERGNLLRNDEDVRNGWVRISATFEHFLPVREVLDSMAHDTFVVD